MVLLSNFGFWLLASSAIASNQATNKDNPLAKVLSPLQAEEFRNTGARWASGIVDAFKKHGSIFKETAEAAYIQMPSEFRDAVENFDALLTQTLSSPQVMEFQKLSAEWTSGVIDAFKNHGAVLKEAAEATYIQMPSEFRNEVEKAHAQIYEIPWKHLSIDIQNWIQEHPYQTAFYVVNGIVFFAPATSSGPVLWALGFTSKGPRAASFASMLQSKFGVVGPKSLFAYVQSAKMGGYGSGAANLAVRLGAAASSLVHGLLGAGEACRNSTAS